MNSRSGLRISMEKMCFIGSETRQQQEMIF